MNGVRRAKRLFITKSSIHISVGVRNRKGYYIMGSTIDQYIVANCLYTIDEFNILYRGWDKPELKIEADENFNEMDIIVRLGYPFKQNAHYTVGESARIKKSTENKP